MKKVIMMIVVMIVLNSCGLRFGNYEAYQHHKMKGNMCKQPRSGCGY